MKTNGLTVSLIVNGSESETGPTGLIERKLNIGDEVIVRIELEQKPGLGRQLFTSNRERQNVQPLRQVVSGKAVFEHTVPIIVPDVIGMGNRYVPDANRNCIHLLEMDDNGNVMVSNLVIKDQRDDYFLMFQQGTFIAQAYRTNAVRGMSQVAVPGLWVEPGFAEIVPFIERYYMQKAAGLQPIGSYKETPPLHTSDLPDDHCFVVKSWSLRYGTGIGVRKDGSLVKLHWSNIITPKRSPAWLMQGEVARAGGFRRPSDPRSKFEFEAVKITRPDFDADTAVA
ncbi:MAG: hypothetical protein WC767_01215 [Candidatus Paceibacterota bacterium]|jgi:hypothetical protein